MASCTCHRNSCEYYVEGAFRSFPLISTCTTGAPMPFPSFREPAPDPEPGSSCAAAVASRGKKCFHPPSCSARWSFGRSRCTRRRIVASPSDVSVISTVLDPGGTASFPSHPHVNTTRRGGSSSTNSPTTTVWPICTRYTPPGLASSCAESPFHRVILPGSVRNANTVSGRASLRSSWASTSVPSVTTPPPLLGLRHSLEGGELDLPQTIDELAELRKALGPDPVDATGPLPPLGDEPGILQHPEVLGHGRTGHLEMGGDLPGAHLRVANQAQDLTPAGLGDGSECGLHDAEQVKPGLTLVSTNNRLDKRVGDYAAEAGLARYLR